MDDQGRASSINAMQSRINLYSIVSSDSIAAGSNVEHREVTQNHERRFVMEIVDSIFDERVGHFTTTSSECQTPVKQIVQTNADRRLQYWKDMLSERQRIARAIQERVGKPPTDVLFNRNTLVDQEKYMVKRVLDFSERMNPVTLITKRLSKLREYCNLNTCLNVNEIEETLPKPEQEKQGVIEIVGVPNSAKEEQFGHPVPCKRSAWLESQALAETIQTKREDIERVVEFYPDIDNLEIIGESCFKNLTVKHNSDIRLIKEDIIKNISSDNTAITDECKADVKLVKEEQPIVYGIKVNDHSYIMGMKSTAQYVEMEVRFDCYPFEKVIKRVFVLENIGEKILNIELVQKPYYPKSHALLRALDDEFVIDSKPFRLISGEKREMFVVFQPRKVNIVKQQWFLKVEPQFFCRRSDAIVLKLSGRCRPPLEYVAKVNSMRNNVIEKSNTHMMSKLGGHLADLTPLVQPDEIICPYQRALEEREIFEQLNPYYVCERYHDLELLKDIHKRIKLPREPQWDLKLDTIFDKIMRLDSPDRRALIFNETMGIIECMRGKPVDIEERIAMSPERERTCFLYVRGIISAGIEEWEAMVIGLENAFIKHAIKNQSSRGEEPSSSYGGGDNATVKERKRKIIVKKVRRQKPFRDSMFVQTYTHVCNFVEDIVSVIESTGVL